MLKIIDCGCAPAGADPEPYAPLVNAGLAQVVGFDAMDGRVIGDGSVRLLHLTKVSLQTSLFEPNPAVLERFENLAPMFELTGTRGVQTERLDDIPECRGASYLKMDVQGAEALVLAGATETLKGVMVVHTEVSFLPFYKGGATMGDVDAALRDAGFHFHLSPGFAQRPMTGVKPVYGRMGTGKQFLYGDFVYIRDLTAWENLTQEQAETMAVILGKCYDSWEMAAWAMEVANG